MKHRYTEDDMLQALQAIAKGLSLRKASLAYGIPRSSLHNRIIGHISRQQGAEGLQKLAPVQEQELTSWILVQEALGHCPTHAQIREIAGRILAISGTNTTLGKRWMQGFLDRNPVLKTKKQFTVDSVRVNGATTEVIKSWFLKLEIPEIKAIKPENRWNMDEAGIMEGQGVNGLVVGHTERRFVQKKQPGSRAWTSFIECISALGRATSPLVIFKGKTVQQQWFPGGLSQFENWQFTATENGWTTNDTAVEWLKKVFIPQTAPARPTDARLLIFDGHGSHESTEFMFECFRNNIYLLFLPPHSSHVLQPLDLSIFSLLMNAYRKELGYLTLYTDSTPIGKRNFLRCYSKARKSSLTAVNIKSGWKATGLWPVNSAKPLMSRLLLENSNNSQLKTPIGSNIDKMLVQYESNSSIAWETPKSGKDLRLRVGSISQLDNINFPTRRQLFRKIAKGFEQKDYELAQAKLRIEQLEARVEQIKPRKKRKVQTSPNSKFANIKTIREAQIAAGELEIDTDDSESSIESSSTGDCIVVNSL
jgi:4-hydroxybenzoate polyprenyltransferase